VLKAKLSYQLCGLLTRILPNRISSKAIAILGLKIPVTPANLAATLVTQAGILIKQLDEIVTRFSDADPSYAVKQDAGEAVTAEIVCALYCLAVAVLGQDEFAAEQSIFQLYTATTFEELHKMLNAAEEFDIPIRGIAHETANLYLYDRPSLADLAQRFSDYVVEPDLKKVKEMNNWSVSFSLKAQIRILVKMHATTRSIAHELLAISIQTHLLNSAKLFKQLRPALVDPA
jgi:hypothetical protein